jgi:hypothetical protein
MSANVYLTNPLPFDIPTWGEHLNSKDPLAMVIRAHLYVEAVLIRHVETAMVNTKRSDIDNLNFPTKVKRAVTAGKVDSSDAVALTALNRLRNRFAHNLTAQLQEQDELDLYNALSKRQRTIAESLGRTPQLQYMGRLRCDLMALIAATNEN